MKYFVRTSCYGTSDMYLKYIALTLRLIRPRYFLIFLLYSIQAIRNLLVVASCN